MRAVIADIHTRILLKDEGRYIYRAEGDKATITYARKIGTTGTVVIAWVSVMVGFHFLLQPSRRCFSPSLSISIHFYLSAIF